jgi:hypothetical protein
MAAVLPTILLSSSCALSLGEEHPICREIAVFARSVSDDEMHVVEYQADMFGRFSESDSLFNKTCSHDGYRPGEELCEYLVEHASAEFMNYNFQNAVSCFEDAEWLRALASDSIVDYAFKLEYEEDNSLAPGVAVTLDFSTAFDERPSRLSISVER